MYASTNAESSSQPRRDKLATSPEDGAAKTRKADPRERQEQIETTDVRLGFMRVLHGGLYSSGP